MLVPSIALGILALLLATTYTPQTIGMDTFDHWDAAICDADDVPGTQELYWSDQSNQGGVWSNVGRIRRSGSGWQQQYIYASLSHVQALACGDFDASHPGNELALGHANGDMTVLKSNSISYDSQSMGQAGTKVWDIAVGEFNAGHPGHELAVTSLNGTNGTRAYEVRGSGTFWQTTQIYTQGNYVAIGELDSAVAGNEIVIVGQTSVQLLRQNSPGSWFPQQIFNQGATRDVKSVIIGEFDDTHDGNEVAFDRNVTNQNAHVYQLYRNASGAWVSRILYYADADEPVDAPTVHHFHGMVLGDWDAARPGQEIAVTHSHVNHAPGRAVLIWVDNGIPAHQVIYSGLDEWHMVAGGDLDLALPGLELVLVGHPTEIVVLGQN